MSPRQDVDVARPGLRPCPHGSYNLWQPDRRGIARGSGCVPRPLPLDLFREPGLHPSAAARDVFAYRTVHSRMPVVD